MPAPCRLFLFVANSGYNRKVRNGSGWKFRKNGLWISANRRERTNGKILNWNSAAGTTQYACCRITSPHTCNWNKRGCREDRGKRDGSCGHCTETGRRKEVQTPVCGWRGRQTAGSTADNYSISRDRNNLFRSKECLRSSSITGGETGLYDWGFLHHTQCFTCISYDNFMKYR